MKDVKSKMLNVNIYDNQKFISTLCFQKTLNYASFSPLYLILTNDSIDLVDSQVGSVSRL